MLLQLFQYFLASKHQLFFLVYVMQLVRELSEVLLRHLVRAGNAVDLGQVLRTNQIKGRVSSSDAFEAFLGCKKD
jgi:hypothetical protein